MAIEFRILGPLEVLREGRPVQPSSQKQRLLTAVLVVHADRVVARDTLIDALWRGDPPATAGGVLQTYVSQLRKVLEPVPPDRGRHRVLQTVEPGYRLEVGPDGCDAHRFERLVGEGRTAVREGRPDVAADRLGRGLDLWRGAALADLADEESVRPEALRLDELVVVASEALMQARLDLGHHAELAGELSRLVDAHPLREGFCAQLMTCLYRVGRQADALAAYGRLRCRLAEELGIGPSPALVQLERDILLQAADLDHVPRPTVELVPRSSTSRPPSNLPEAHSAFRFVGRGAELAELQTWWEAGAPDDPGVLVTGEAGVGKTRLVTEFAGELERTGVRVLYGRALEADGSPYEPVLGALRQFVVGAEDHEIRSIGDGAAAALALLVPELAERRPGVALAPGWDRLDRSWLLDRVADALASGDGPPLVMVLDDLQWADRPAMLLLARLLARGGRIRVVGTVREPGGPSSSPLVELLAQLRRDERPLRRRPVGGLTRTDVAELVAALAGSGVSLAARAFSADLHRRTEGNAFFVRETIRHLEETGAISASEGRWGAERPLAELGIPAGVLDVVGHRLDGLSPRTGEVLRAAAVLGPEFDLDLVAAVLDLPEGPVLDALEEAHGSGLLEEGSAMDRFRFAHALVHEVLLSALPRSRRARLEWRAGEALEDLRADGLDDRIGDVARHYADGVAVGDARIAVDRCSRAAARAMERCSYEEAVRHHERALRSLEAAVGREDGERADLLIALGRASNAAGDASRRRAACSEAAGIAQRIADPERLAVAALGLLGSLGPSAADPEVTAILERAIVGLAATDPSVRRDTLLAEVLARLAGHVSDDDPDRSAVLCDEAVVVARRAGDDRCLALALLLSSQGAGLGQRRHRALVDEATTLTSRAGDPEVVLRAHTNQMVYGLTWADRARFDQHLASYAEVAQAMRSRVHELHSDIDRAGAAALDGRYLEALVQLRDAGRRCQRFDDPSIWADVGVGILPVNRELGLLRRSVDRMRFDAAATPTRPVIRATLTWALCETGELAEGRERLQALVARPVGLRAGFLRRIALVSLVEACDLVGDAHVSERLYPWMREELDSGTCVAVGPGAFLGAIERCLGLLARMLGEVDAAVEHLEAALEVHRRMEAPGWVARSRYDLGRALVLRAAPRDAERAAALLHAADGRARALGMQRLVEQLRLEPITR